MSHGSGQSGGGTRSRTGTFSRLGVSRIGPGFLVAAAFIGPGTVVTASKAGAQFGCELLWTILFASIGAIVLQSFAARLGIVTGGGLGDYLRKTLQASVWLKPVSVLVILALGVGNAAYQAGNLSGAAKGLASVFGGQISGWVTALAVLTVALIGLGRFRWLQRLLVTLVIILSVCFLLTAAVSLPALPRITSGLLIPRVSLESLTIVVAMIGTTIVPYNLFLHASVAARNWKDVEPSMAIRESNWDSGLSIALGGVVTASILLTASRVFFDDGQPLGDVAEISAQLKPVLGWFAGPAFGIGLFCAGLTSAITAPLATGYALCGILGWNPEVRSLPFRVIAGSIILVGGLFAALAGSSPSQIIVVAQVANGLLLPLVAVVLLWASMRHQANRPPGWLVAIGWMVVLFVSGLAIWRVYAAIS